MYTDEIKNEAIRKIQDRKSIKQISEEMHISQSTLYKWKNCINQKLENEQLEIEEAKRVSKEIKQLIHDGEFEKAEILGEKYEDNIIIQSQMITVAIIKKDYKKAKEIGKKFIDYPPIQAQMLTIAIEEKDYTKIQEISERFKNYLPVQTQISKLIKQLINNKEFQKAQQLGIIFTDDPPIQSQMLTIAIEEKDYTKIQEISERFKNYLPIQSQMLTIAIEEKDYTKIQEISERFKNSLPVQTQISKLIKQLINNKEFQKAQQLGIIFTDDPSIQSQMLTIAIEEKDYTKIQEISERFKNSLPVQTQISKLIKQLINNKEFQKAQQLGIIFTDDPSIQAQMLTIAIKEKDYTKIQEISERFKNYLPVQRQISKLIKQLIHDGEFEKAEILGEKYEDNIIIQSQMLTIAIEEKDYTKIQEISERFKNYLPVQRQISKLIKQLINNKEFQKAQQLGIIFTDDPIIQAQMLTIAIEKKDYTKIQEISERFKNYLSVQTRISKLIKQLIHDGEFEKAEILGEKYEDNIIIQSQMLTIAIEKKDYTKIQEISERFLEDEIIQSQVKKIEINEKSKNEIYEVKKRKLRYLGILKTKIYFDKINDDVIKEISESEILSEYEKTIIFLAICEKHNMLRNARQISSKFNTEDKTQKSEINKILDRINSKKKMFDFGKYDMILKWRFDEKLLKQYMEETKTYPEKKNNMTDSNKLETRENISEEQSQNYDTSR